MTYRADELETMPISDIGRALRKYRMTHGAVRVYAVRKGGKSSASEPRYRPMTQRQLAKLIGVAQASIGDREVGRYGDGSRKNGSEVERKIRAFLVEAGLL